MNAPTATSPELPAQSPLETEAPTHAKTRAERWLGPDAAPTWAGEATRLLLGVGLSAAFGVALGLRHGGLSIFQSALGVPAGIAAVAAVAIPAFAIVLALANAPLAGMHLSQATARGVVRAGLFLAGVAPAAALLVVTVEDALTVDVLGFGALAFAGWIAASSFARDLRPSLARAPAATRAALTVALPAFLLFASVLAIRVWWLALPVLSEVR
ncbi:MAG TPA: hypothetical protein VIY73_07745 [Polyangiaceae bacterium]